MSQLFGEPQNIPELENEKYGSGKSYFYYIVPISKIDKIIGKKNIETHRLLVNKMENNLRES